jgi:hypothetical protein
MSSNDPIRITEGKGASIGFDIPLVNESLGGSFIYEEYKADFAAARAIAETAISFAAADESNRGEAFLALGLVQLLRGISLRRILLLPKRTRGRHRTPTCGTLLLPVITSLRCISTDWLLVAAYSLLS